LNGAARVFQRYEVEHLLARSEFTVIDVFGNFDKSRLADDSREMIFVAEKNAARRRVKED
jgi:hypothetical protein